MDRQRQILVSLGSDGTGVAAYGADMSADGGVVVFVSSSPSVTPDSPPRTKAGLYLRDIAAGTTRLVHAFPQGDYPVAGAPSLSADGSVVVIAVPYRLPDGSLRSRLYATDVATGATRQLLPGADDRGARGIVQDVRISADGSHVVFTSTDSSLVPQDDNGARDVYELDVATGMVTLVSAAKDGASGDDVSSRPALSADGRYVCFVSAASNLVDGVRTRGLHDVFLRDLLVGVTTQVNEETSGYPQSRVFDCAISSDGQRVVYSGSPERSRYNHYLYLRDAGTATPRELTYGAASYVLSPDGRTVTFDTNTYHRRSQVTLQLQIGSGQSKVVVLPYRAPNHSYSVDLRATSTDGRFFLFSSDGTNLTPLPGQLPGVFRNDVTRF